MNSPELGIRGISTTWRSFTRRSRTSDSGIIGRHQFFQHRERAVRPSNIQPYRGTLCLIFAIAIVIVCLTYRLEIANSPRAEATDSPAIESGPGPKIVMGNVYDPLGDPAVSVKVYVSMKSGSIVLKTLNNTTDSSGFYIVTFDRLDWDVGDTIEANATIESDTVWNSTIADVNPTQTVDLRFALIPEFGDGFLLVVSGIVVVIVVASRLRR